MKQMQQARRPGTAFEQVRADFEQKRAGMAQPQANPEVSLGQDFLSAPGALIKGAVRGFAERGGDIENFLNALAQRVAVPALRNSPLNRVAPLNEQALQAVQQGLDMGRTVENPNEPFERAANYVAPPTVAEQQNPFGPSAMLSQAGQMVPQITSYMINPVAGVADTFASTAGSSLERYEEANPGAPGKALAMATGNAAIQAGIERFSPIYKLARGLPIGGIGRGAAGEAATEVSQQVTEEIGQWFMLPPEKRNSAQLSESARNVIMAGYYALLPGGVAGGIESVAGQPPAPPAPPAQEAQPQPASPLAVPPATPPAAQPPAGPIDTAVEGVAQQPPQGEIADDPVTQEERRRLRGLPPQQTPEAPAEQGAGVAPVAPVAPDETAIATAPPPPPAPPVAPSAPEMAQRPARPYPAPPMAPPPRPPVAPPINSPPISAPPAETPPAAPVAPPSPAPPLKGRQGSLFDEPAGEPDYNGMSMAQLRREARKLGIKTAGAANSKQQLIGWIRDARKKQAEAAQPEPMQPPAAAKEPWQMGLDEFMQREKIPDGLDYMGLNRFRSDQRNRHRAAVAQAMREGKPVPAEIIDQYPGLREEWIEWAKGRESAPAGPAPQPPAAPDSSPDLEAKLAETERRNQSRRELEAEISKEPISKLREYARLAGVAERLGGRFRPRGALIKGIAEAAYPDDVAKPALGKKLLDPNAKSGENAGNEPTAPKKPTASGSGKQPRREPSREVRDGSNPDARREDRNNGLRPTGKSIKNPGSVPPFVHAERVRAHIRALESVLSKYFPRSKVVEETDSHIVILHPGGARTRLSIKERVGNGFLNERDWGNIVASYLENVGSNTSFPFRGQIIRGPRSLADFERWSRERKLQFMTALDENNSCGGQYDPGTGEIQIRYEARDFARLESVYFEEFNHLACRWLDLKEVLECQAATRSRTVAATFERVAKLAEEYAKSPSTFERGDHRLRRIIPIIKKTLDGTTLEKPEMPNWTQQLAVLQQEAREGRGNHPFRLRGIEQEVFAVTGPVQQEVSERIREDEPSPPGLGQQIRESFRKPNGFSVTWLDKMRAGVQDHLWPLVKAMRVANGDSRGGVPEMLLRLYAGVGGKIDEQFRSGLRDHKGKYLDDHGRRMDVNWLLEGFDYSSPEAARDTMRDMFILGVAERTLEKNMLRENEVHAKMMEYQTARMQALAGRQQLKQAKTKADTIGAAKVVRDNSRKLREIKAEWKQARRSLKNPISGIGQNSQFASPQNPGKSDVEQAKAVIDEMKQDVLRYDRARENLRRYRKFGNAVLDYMKDKGFIDQETRDNIDKENQFYINFKRVLGEWEEDSDRSGSGLSSVLPKFKGSQREIDNPLVSLLIGAEKMIRAADRNFVWAMFARQVQRAKMKDIGERLDKPRQKGRPKPRQFLQSTGGTYLGDTVKIRIKGEEQKWKFQPDVLRAMKALSDHMPEQLSGILNMPGKLTREMVTMSPGFMIRNAIRDSINRAIISESDSKPWEILKGMSKKEIEDLAYYGGSQEVSEVSGRRAEYWKAVKKKMDELAGQKQTILMKAAIPFRAWNKVRQASEQVGRVAEFRTAYRQAKARGKSDYRASMEAAYKSRDLLDFAVAGHVIKAINSFMYIPFLNAQVQGVTRTMRAWRDNPRASAIRWSLYVLAPTLAAYALAAAGGEDNEREYLALPAWRRDMFFNIKIGNVWLTIPKPFEMGVAASGVERAIDLVRGNRRAFKGYGGSIRQATLGVANEFITGPFSALIENWANYSFFFDRHIVPPWEDGLRLELRNTSSASGISRALSDMLSKAGMEYDPRKIDNLVRSVGGGLGGASLDASNLGREDSQPARLAMSLTGILAAQPAGSSMDIKNTLDTAGELGDDSRVVRDLRALIGVANSSPSLSERSIYLKQARDRAERVQEFYDEMYDEVMEFQKFRKSASQVEQRAEKLPPEQEAAYLRDNNAVILAGRRADRVWERVAALRQQAIRFPDRRDRVFEQIRELLTSIQESPTAKTRQPELQPQ